MLGGQSLFVNAVAGFMEDAEERFAEMVRIIARGDAAIAGTDAAAKGMRGHVESAGVEVEADSSGSFPADTLLLFYGIRALEPITVRFAAGSNDGGDQRHQFRTQGGEERGDL